jgi:signal transduction histidine kinase
MINNLRIRQRILFIFLSVALSGSLLQLVVAGVQIQNATFNFHYQQLSISALTLASSLSEPFEEFEKDQDDEDIKILVDIFKNNEPYDFIVLDSQHSPIFTVSGNILPITFFELTNKNTKEIIATDQDGYERLYVTTPILYEDRTLGYVMVSNLMQVINQEIMQRWIELGLGTLPIMILVIVASLWLANTMSNPIRALERGALLMAEGRLDTRIDLNSQDEIGQLAKSFNYMAEQIDTLIKVQRSFISNAAHELRTPLMSLSLRIEALQGNTLDEAEKMTYLGDLQRELEHMTTLVSSLLNLARIDEGRVQYTEPITDLSASLKDISRHWRIATQKVDLTFEAVIPDTLPSISIDQNQLRLICDNLLGNAVKYTHEGHIQFYTTASDSHLQLRIIDTGIGFTHKQSEYLFDRFYRTDVARADFTGTGLGLSIIYSLLKQVGGTIEASSDGVNQGATFIVSLPIQKP